MTLKVSFSRALMLVSTMNESSLMIRWAAFRRKFSPILKLMTFLNFRENIRPFFHDLLQILSVVERCLLRQKCNWFPINLGLKLLYLWKFDEIFLHVHHPWEAAEFDLTIRKSCRGSFHKGSSRLLHRWPLAWHRPDWECGPGCWLIQKWGRKGLGRKAVFSAAALGVCPIAPELCNIHCSKVVLPTRPNEDALHEGDRAKRMNNFWRFGREWTCS